MLGNTFSSELAQNYELWLAYYGDYNNLEGIQTNWDNYIGIQYADNGEIAGISGSVDKDLFTKYIFLDEENVTEIHSTGTMTTNYNTKTIYYTVQSGNTLGEIAAEYGTTAEELGKINGIVNINLIYPGEKIRILTNTNIPGNEERQMNEIIYVVKKGNTLSQIASAYNVSIESLVSLNGIENPNLIYPGEKIRITGSNSEYLDPLTNTNNEYYIVKSGDTLWSIARKNGITVNQILQKNTITNPNLIYPGQRIRL